MPSGTKPDDWCNERVAQLPGDRDHALEVELPPCTGFHAFQRTFATELKAVPLPDFFALGGWKDAKIILTYYQAPDQDTMHAPWAAGRTRRRF